MSSEYPDEIVFGHNEQADPVTIRGPVVIGQAGRGKSNLMAVLAAGEKFHVVKARSAQITANRESISALDAEAAEHFRRARAIPWWRARRFSREIKQIELLLARKSAIQDENDRLDAANARDMGRH